MTTLACAKLTAVMPAQAIPRARLWSVTASGIVIGMLAPIDTMPSAS